MKRKENDMKTHDVKCWPEWFNPLWEGRKPFEVRFNDRDYQKDDILNIREFDPGIGEYSGRMVKTDITYVLTDPEHPFKLPDGYCVLGLRVIYNMKHK